MMVRVDANESGMLKPAGASYVKLCKMKVLVPIDGSSPSKRAIRHLLQLAQAHEPLELHLLNVQESADAPQLMRFRKTEEIEQLSSTMARRCWRSRNASWIAPA